MVRDWPLIKAHRNFAILSSSPPPGLSEHAKQWSRNCPDSKYCWEAKPVIDTAEAMEDLVGGDWNDDYWGESGGFIYG